eukprot:c8051_g2_i1.p1 GENE.c8051_g2_i1~~c8051_g2_i1.p1  ORF type:complete len:112 (-),score=28.58 c8051_g2_i1:33-368(-)
MKKTDQTTTTSDKTSEADVTKLEDQIYWVRQAIGVLLGAIFGATPLFGAVWVIGGVILNYVATWIYYAKILDIDELDMNMESGHLAQLGAMPSVALFFVIWIITFSITQFP